LDKAASVFRAIVNRSRACPPLFLSAIFVAEWRTGGPARCVSGGLACLPSHGRIIHMKGNPRIKTCSLFISCFRTDVPLFLLFGPVLYNSLKLASAGEGEFCLKKR
jgi:hypothetical protein